MKKSKHITKHIFITGGVVSSLGKGLTGASIGRLLVSHGLSVRMQKLDPYLNVDPRNIDPCQHGEIFITDDGSETDLDVGHYERFLNINLTHNANATTGKIYSSVLKKERQGGFNGGTVQVIPHITNAIKEKIRQLASDDVDVIITEIGGTVGDIESQPFLEAARQVIHELGEHNVLSIHISLLPYIGPSKELKTKPTQHSVAMLRSLGITPDVLVLRSAYVASQELKEKIALMCDVPVRGVINCSDAKNIYQIPKVLKDEKLDEYILDQFQLKHTPLSDNDWNKWLKLLDIIDNPEGEVNVGLITKYIDFPDIYLSTVEAVKSAAFNSGYAVNIKWIDSEELTSDDKVKEALGEIDALVVPDENEITGIENMLRAIKYARENNLPTLGISFGMQLMAVEYAKNVVGIKHPAFDSNSNEAIVVGVGCEKNSDEETGCNLCVGSYDFTVDKKSLAEKVYKKTDKKERHRNYFELNPKYYDLFEKNGLKISGKTVNKKIAEVIELDQSVHPYYIGVQGHPEFKSRPIAPHPIFLGLLENCIKK